MQTKALDILEIPFNKVINLERSDKDQYILMLKDQSSLHNHLETLHAGVLFSVAESSSGEYLLQTFSHLKMEIIPVIRKAEIKYSTPGKGAVYSNAELISPTVREVDEMLETKKRVVIRVRADVFNEEDQRLLTAHFEWFVAVA